jgi:catecholate siderophore receptor
MIKQSKWKKMGALLPLGMLLSGSNFAAEPIEKDIDKNQENPVSVSSINYDDGDINGDIIEEITLPDVKVKSKRDSFIMGETKGYQAKETKVGKIVQELRDVPQSLTVVTKELMKDRNAHTMRDALRNVPGLTFNAGEGGRTGDQVTIRGYSAVGDLYLDGVRDIAQYNRETFNLEQIDVLRGSTSMLFGRGSTGGVINQVSKQALAKDQFKFESTYGAYDYKRFTTDLNKHISDDMAARLNMMYTDTDSFRTGAEYSRFGFAPTFRWGMGTPTEMSVSYLYQNENNVPDYGIPYYQGKPLDVPVDRYYGLANADYEKYETHLGTVSLTHHFSDDVAVNSILRKGNYERDVWATAPRLNLNSTGGILTDNTVVNRSRPGRAGTEDMVNSQTNLTVNFDTFGMKHQTLAGLEVSSEDSYTQRWSNVQGIVPTTTVGNPNITPILPANINIKSGITETTFTSMTVGTYFQDFLEITPEWKLLAGTRYDTFSADYERSAPLGPLTREDNVWSYRVGLLYQPTYQQSYYVSHGTSFNPSGELYALDPRGANTAPEMNENIEVGAKWDLFEGDLSLRTALFRSEKTNERNTDPLMTQVYLLSGRRHTDGVEFEGAGRITDNWEVFGGASLMKGEIDEHLDKTNIGKWSLNTPNYTGNFWTTYKFFGNWKIGGGLEAVGRRYTAINNTTELPDYIRFDAMIAYEHKNFTARVNGFNLTDEKYYDGLYQGHTMPGAEPTVQAALELKF